MINALLLSFLVTTAVLMPIICIITYRNVTIIAQRMCPSKLIELILYLCLLSNWIYRLTNDSTAMHMPVMCILT